MEAIERDCENFSLDEVLHHPGNRPPPRYELLALFVATQYLQVYPGTPVWSVSHGTVPGMSPPQQQEQFLPED